MKKLYDLANLTLLLLTGVFVYGAYPAAAGPHPDALRLRGTPGPLGRPGASSSSWPSCRFVMTAVFYLLIRYIPEVGGQSPVP
ncbi:MAG: hypothetical protein M0C28_02015 [Candidatus Moduliflexus flocculans]|nr:hypothetical protein [Candidatus Moduliflexus flocculans]